MQFTYVDKLEIGDPILVAESGSFLSFGWFVGYGRNTVQFITPRAVVYNDECQKKDPRKPIKIWKSYVQQTHRFRVAKIQEPVFSDLEEKETYEKAKRILIDKGMIKN